MKLYEVAVIYRPCEKAKKQGKGAKLVLPITALLAKDDESAKLSAARMVSNEFEVDELEVLARPFR